MVVLKALTDQWRYGLAVWTLVFLPEGLELFVGYPYWSWQSRNEGRIIAVLSELRNKELQVILLIDDDDD